MVFLDRFHRAESREIRIIQGENLLIAYEKYRTATEAVAKRYVRPRSSVNRNIFRIIVDFIVRSQFQVFGDLFDGAS